MSESASASSFPHAVTWFEIPVTDFERAARFYESVLETTLGREICDLGGNPVAIFPHQPGQVSGCLSGGGAVPSTRDGITLYLLCRGSLDGALERATALGGAIVTPITALPGGLGRYAVITDCEGNRVGLHQFAA